MKTLFYSITDYWVVARERETDQVVWKLYLRSYLWHLKKRPHILLQTGEKFLVASWAGGNVTIDADNGKVTRHTRDMGFPSKHNFSEN